MAKKNLDSILQRLAQKIDSEAIYRDTVNQHTHEYRVDRKKLWRELYAQISGLYVQDPKSLKFYFNNKNAPGLTKVLNEFLDKYVENLYMRASTYKGAKVQVTDIKKQPDGGFSVRLTGDGKSDVFDAVNRIRSSTTTDVKYLLPELRKDVYEAVMNSDFIKNLQATSKDPSHIESTIRRRTIGKEYIDKGKKKIMGGLFEAGHGTGYSVVEQDIRDSILLGDNGLQETINSLPSELQEVGKLRLMVNKMTATSKEIVYLFEQGELHNSFRATKERQLRTLLQKEVANFTKSMPDSFWIDFESSSSIRTGVRHTVLTPLQKGINKRIYKGKVDLPKLQGINTTPEATPVSLKAKVSKTTSTASNKVNVTQKNPAKIKDTTAPKMDQNWSSLLPLINSKLTPRVIANMRFPSLVNRTGAFAESAKVINVETTKEGFPSFVFDYERDPYNVFDRTIGTAPWNTPERDPKAIVDKSVREIIREMAIGRFYTRRV